MRTLASLPTRLSDFGATQSKQLINWGYAIAIVASALTIMRLNRKGCPRHSGLIQRPHSPNHRLRWPGDSELRSEFPPPPGRRFAPPNAGVGAPHSSTNGIRRRDFSNFGASASLTPQAHTQARRQGDDIRPGPSQRGNDPYPCSPRCGRRGAWHLTQHFSICASRCGRGSKHSGCGGGGIACQQHRGGPPAALMLGAFRRSNHPQYFVSHSRRGP